MNDPLGENTSRLAGLLGGRDGWRCEAFDNEDHWLFGVDGAGRLVITPEMEGFRMYRADQDWSWVISRIEQVAAWLDEHEQEHSGPTRLQEQWRRAAEELGARAPED